MSSAHTLPILFTTPPAEHGKSALRWTWLAVGLVVALGGLAYSNSFSVPFVYDGRAQLLPSLEASASRGPLAVLVEGRARPVVFLSFYAERLAHGLNLAACHATNLSIHVAAALVLFGIVRHTLRAPRLADRYGRYADRLALTVALIWLVHPLQTQSVTYLYQRYESLMGLFYLLTLYTFIRGTEGSGCKGWLTISALACSLAVFSKEVAATAPVLILWYDRVFVARSWGEIFRRRWGYYVALFVSCAALIGVILSHREAYGENGVLWIEKVSALEYARTQPEVILHYLRLVAWPTGQCLDPRWPVAHDPRQIALPGMAIVVTLAVAAWAAVRRPELGFLLGSFFLLLAPTSSIAPIADLAYEHRMYLPLASVVTVLVLGLHAACSRWFTVGLQPRAVSAVAWWGMIAVVLATLITLTLRRNEVYRTDETLWADVLVQSPQNDRAYTNLGIAKQARGDLAGALLDFHQAIELAPELSSVHFNRGLCRLKLGAYIEALTDLNRALKLNPKYAESWGTRATCYQALGRLEEARADAKEYFRLGGAPHDDLQRMAAGSGARVQGSGLREFESALPTTAH